MPLKRSIFKAAIGIAALAIPAISPAADFPAKPLRMIIPFSPGGALDNVGRVLAEQMEGHLGKPIVIENRPGGNYLIATRAMLDAGPDGHTFMLTTNGMLAIGPVLYSKTPFNAVKDFSHIGLVSSYPYVLIAGKGRFPDFKTVLQTATAKPESISMAYTGHVTSLAVEMLGISTKSKLLKIPYKGDPDAISDLAAGRVDIGMVGPSVALPLIESAKVDALAVTTNERLPSLQNVPTVNEQSLEGFNVKVWTALIAPPGIPEGARAALHDALRKTQESAAFQERIAQIGGTIQPGDGTALRKQIEDDQAMWKGVMDKAGLKPVDL
jgi:tripartite-type tricarboxylate transporter receptor subunit TctC